MVNDSPIAEPTPQSLALAPGMTVQSLYAAVGQALANAGANAVTAQQMASMLAITTVTGGISALFYIDTTTLGAASQQELAKARTGPASGNGK